MSPYLYSLEYRAHKTGLPIMQPMFMVFQNDSNTYNEGVDFMWGDSLLVANVVEKGAEIREVYYLIQEIKIYVFMIIIPETNMKAARL